MILMRDDWGPRESGKDTHCMALLDGYQDVCMACMLSILNDNSPDSGPRDL
jgi:hypothetical protein